jgi:hypothetical protein
MKSTVIRYIIDLCRAKVIRAKDFCFHPTLMDGDFPLRPSQSYKLKVSYNADFPGLLGAQPLLR